MERQDDAEHHEDASGDDPSTGDYPRGRGYGQDYMRGGEVFGGYGYSERPDYTRPLAGQRCGEDMAQPAEEAGTTTRRESGPGPGGAPDEHAEAGRSTEEEEGEEPRFPQDARAGQWDRPAPTVLEEPDAATATPRGAPPVPKIEGAYGTEGNRNRSRSYYLTQAQLQYRSAQPPGGR